MSLLWMEGLDTYGGNTAYALDGLWADFNHTISAANPRTGTHAMRMNGSNTGPIARRVFGGEKAAVGIGYGMYMATLPANNNMVNTEWRSGANAYQCSFSVQTTGDIRAYRGGPIGATTDLGNTSAPAVTASAYNHIEALAVMSTGSAGSMEIRVNEVTVLNASGINTGGATTAQCAIGEPHITFPPTTDYDDIFAWSTETGVDPVGGDVVDFVGDRRVYEDMTDEDGTEQNWSRSSGSASWPLLDEKPPNDETDYLYTSAAGATVAQRFPALPASVISVVALQFDHRSKKTDAGTAFAQGSARSGSGLSDGLATGADRPVTTAYTYWFDVFQADPDTGVPWVPAAAETAEYVLERTA